MPGNSALGKKTAYPDRYTPELLCPIARSESRALLGVGAGASIPVGSKKGGLANVVELKVDLVQRLGDKTVWEGTAERTLEPGIVDRSAVVKDLAAALFKDFPGKSGKTVTVK